ncbi:unnamed protein product [Darwinula stevensoni]|uniref:Uncharacterized protein n=1 Tax=Darwinula stevensoni TaxID=69355 RepID=A0A7R8X8Y3_9CRUS|nr:unnamed protein product [Darwinula stevensoni]CAG0883917.1 unnamed protein product [Darwinula stevensoni]
MHDEGLISCPKRTGLPRGDGRGCLGARVQMAEAAKYEAERSFEECSDVAREEIKRFHRVRSTELKTAIGQYAETQVKLARDTYAMVTQALASFSQLPIHFPSQNSS